MVLVAAIGGSVAGTTVVAVVGGTVLLGVPMGGRVCVLVVPSLTLQVASKNVTTSSAMPNRTHPKRFIATNRRSLVAGC